MTTYQLLDLVRHRTAMYCGVASVSNLRSFIDGYFFGMHQVRITVPEELPDFGGFHDWVAEKLGYAESTSGWSNMIASQRVDPEEALHLFYQLLDEYRGLHPRVLAEAVLDVDYSLLTVEYFIHPGRWEFTGYLRPTPTSVVIEEVLPHKEWVSLTVRKNDSILAQRGYDSMKIAILEAEEFLSVPLGSWKILTASA